MIEHMEASVVLFKIRQVCLRNASAAQILETPLAEMMEQMLADRPYMEMVEWLVNKFWSDETRQEPMDGTPLIDPDGKLWTREAFGDELSDSDYQLAERLYRLAEWGSQLLYHQDFDLSLIIADYKPQFDETEFVIENEQLVKWVKETPLRRLAAVTVNQVYRKVIDKAIAENQAIQDYMAECYHGADPSWWDIPSCEEYITDVLKALEDVSQHCAEARRWALSTEEQHVADMVWGWVPHDFDEGLVAASREICQVAEKLLPAQTEIRHDTGARTYINKVIPEIQRICQQHDVYFDPEDSYGLPTLYLQSWLKNKYWDGRKQY